MSIHYLAFHSEFFDKATFFLKSGDTIIKKKVMKYSNFGDTGSSSSVIYNQAVFKATKNLTFSNEQANLNVHWFDLGDVVNNT